MQIVSETYPKLLSLPYHPTQQSDAKRSVKIVTYS